MGRQTPSHGGHGGSLRSMMEGGEEGDSASRMSQPAPRVVTVPSVLPRRPQASLGLVSPRKPSPVSHNGVAQTCRLASTTVEQLDASVRAFHITLQLQAGDAMFANRSRTWSFAAFFRSARHAVHGPVAGWTRHRGSRTASRPTVARSQPPLSSVRVEASFLPRRPASRPFWAPACDEGSLCRSPDLTSWAYPFGVDSMPVECDRASTRAVLCAPSSAPRRRPKPVLTTEGAQPLFRRLWGRSFQLSWAAAPTTYWTQVPAALSRPSSSSYPAAY